MVDWISSKFNTADYFTQLCADLTAVFIGFIIVKAVSCSYGLSMREMAARWWFGRRMILKLVRCEYEEQVHRQVNFGALVLVFRYENSHFNPQRTNYYKVLMELCMPEFQGDVMKKTAWQLEPLQNQQRDFGILYLCPILPERKVDVERKLRENDKIKIQINVELVRRNDKTDKFTFSDSVVWHSPMELMPEAEASALARSILRVNVITLIPPVAPVVLPS